MNLFFYGLLFICTSFHSSELYATLHEGYAKSTYNVNSELVDVLLKYGNHPKHWSPLNYALEEKDYPAALILIKFDNDINKNDGAWLPLDRLCNKIENKLSNEQEELLRVFFSLGARNSHGLSTNALIFHKAANFGSFDLINWLLSYNIDLYEKKGYPFLGAVSSGNLFLVKHLLSLGIDVTKINGILNTAVASHNLELVMYVWEELNIKPFPDWGSPLYVAILSHDLDILAYLLSAGLSPNEKNDPILKRALHLPESTDFEKEYKKTVVELLLDYGAKL